MGGGASHLNDQKAMMESERQRAMAAYKKKLVEDLGLSQLGGLLEGEEYEQYDTKKPSPSPV